MRVCLICKTEKDDTEFPHRRKLKDGTWALYKYCRDCHKTNQYFWVIENLFLLSREDFEKIKAHQKGKCAICGCKELPNRRLSLDHRHSDGLIRGLLCNMCNRALAKFKDDVERFRKALNYLLSPPATEALGRERFGLEGRMRTKKQRKKAAQIREIRASL